MPARLSIIGKRFGRLIVLAEADNRSSPNGQTRRYSLCVCECGKQLEITNGSLTSGHSTSCGCLRLETTKKSSFIHGHAVGGKRSITLQSYDDMLKRCHNLNTKNYHRYGGRGIFVCDRWRESFLNFLEDMGECPPDLSLERKDNSLGYSKENCVWASVHAQSRNKRSNINVTVQSFTGCLKDVCIHFGKTSFNDYCRILHRVNHGWEPEAAIFAPIGSRKKKVTLQFKQCSVQSNASP